jgi:hypothetical protein
VITYESASRRCRQTEFSFAEGPLSDRASQSPTADQNRRLMRRTVARKSGWAVGQEWNNVGPRLGFAYSINEQRTVVRGGWGLYFVGPKDQWSHHTPANLSYALWTALPDRRPDFFADPFQGTPNFRGLTEPAHVSGVPHTSLRRGRGISRVIGTRCPTAIRRRQVTAEASPLYGAPQQNFNVAYLPRMLQLGFRFSF